MSHACSSMSAFFLFMPTIYVRAMLCWTLLPCCAACACFLCQQPNQGSLSEEREARAVLSSLFLCIWYKSPAFLSLSLIHVRLRRWFVR